MSARAILRFLAQLAVAVALGAGAALATYGVFRGYGWETAQRIAGSNWRVLFSIADALPYITAGVVLLVGLMKRRPGLVIGALIFALGFVLLTSEQARTNAAALEQGVATASAADQRDLAVQSDRFDIIAVDGEDYCRAICMQILAQSNYAFASRRSAKFKRWHLYRRVEGAACLLRENRASYLEFLEARYVGLCAVHELWEPAGPYLYVMENSCYFGQCRFDSLAPIAGPHFNGNVFEARERREGADVLLGRWLAGMVVEPRNFYDPGAHRKSVDVGIKFEDADFFSALLGIPINPRRAPGPASSAQLLDALLPLVDSTDYGDRARRLADGIELEGREQTPAPATVP